jgi:PAS domain S-box-containing protein
MIAQAYVAEGKSQVAWVAALTHWWRNWRRNRRAGAGLLQSIEAQFAALLVNAEIGLAITDDHGTFLRTNAALQRFLGYDAGELGGRSMCALSHPQDAASHESLCAEMQTGKRSSYRVEQRFVRRDGSIAWGRLTVSALRTATGQGQRCAYLVEDITQERATQERLDATLLAASEANLRLKMYLQRSPLACILWDRNQIIREWNPAAEEMFGYSAVEAIGRGVYELTMMPDAMRVVERVCGELCVGREHPDGIVIDNRRKDGSRFTCHWHFTVIDAAQDGCDAVIAFGIDISSRLRGEQERRILEANLRHAQKMQSLGTLAGGIAHDFNNILLAISGNARLAVQELSPDHAAQVSLREVTRAANRAASIVNQILLFSRREDEPAHAPVQLSQLVSEALGLLRATIPARIAFKTDLQAQLPLVQGDAAQLHQVLVNLATNAAYAMSERGGRMSIELRRLLVDATDTRALSGLQPGQHVRLSVSDTGAGMSPAVVERIFEPFFTTKPQGQGTGLGLSVVHGIVAAHRGAITVNSIEGQGSTFHVYLPALLQPASASATAAVSVERGRGQHVLYLDDEEPLVYLVKRVLERLGYRVSGFTEPQEALQAFAAAPVAFDAVITDLSMPGLSGTDFAKQILQLRGDVPVIITSGYVRTQDREAALKAGVRELVLKPNTVEELGSVLHKLLVG